jgi:hypothetical protein
MIQIASDTGNAAGLVYFIFDLIHLDGEDLCSLETSCATPVLSIGGSPSRKLRAGVRLPHSDH